MANKSKVVLVNPLLTQKEIQLRFIYNASTQIYTMMLGEENARLPHNVDQIVSSLMKKIAAGGAASEAELGYLVGVTSAIQTQLNSKPTATLDGNAAHYIDGTGALTTPAGSGGGTTWALGAIPPITSPVAVQIQQGNLSTIGHNDVYTCPANKRAWIRNLAIRNNSGAATVIAFPEIKISGTYYRAAANVTATNTNQSTLGGTTFGNYILNAAESISVNVDAAGLNVFGWVIEFPSTNLFYTSRINNLANGDNTLYTTPAGKTAYILNDSISEPPRRGVVSIVNAIGGGGPTWNVYTVPNGGSTGATNLGTTTVGAADKTYTRNDQGTILNTGDFIVVNTSVGTAGQIAWLSVYEF